MKRRLSVRRSSAMLFSALGVVLASLGLTCPDQGDGTAPFNPPVALGNRAPRILITAVETPQGENFAEQGDTITIRFSGEDTEDEARVRVFASTSADPSVGELIPILSNFPIGPGPGSGAAFWRTTAVSPGSYHIFAEIDDGTLGRDPVNGNPPVMVTFVEPILVAPMGTGPESGSPSIEIDLPATDAGLSNEDILTLVFSVTDPNSDVDTITLTYFLDKDRNASNDDEQPPLEVGSDTIVPGTAAPGQPEFRRVEIEIDLNQLPIRRETDEGGRPLPYFVRVRADDGTGNVVDEYAVGAVRLTAAPVDVVDLLTVGGTRAGVTWQGFNGDPMDPSLGGRAGAAFTPLGDVDGDGLDDFAIVAETARPFGRPGVGETYLIYGRQRRLDPDAPDFQFNQGRYSGVLDLNTVGSFIPFPEEDPRFNTVFNIRGSIISGPRPFRSTGPFTPFGMTSVARMPDMTLDGRPELIIGAPFYDSIEDLEDDDPCDTCTFDVMDRTPLTCFDKRPFFSTLTSGIALPAFPFDDPEDNPDRWLPYNPANPLVFVPPNVVIDAISDEDTTDDMLGPRLAELFTFIVNFEGEAGANFDMTVKLDGATGPEQTMNVTVNIDEGEDTGVWAQGFAFQVRQDPGNFPTGNSDPPNDFVPASVMDGKFTVFVKFNPPPGAGFQLTAAGVTLTGRIADPEEHPIRFDYEDSFPGRISDASGCDNLDPDPVDPIALAALAPACPPMNRRETLLPDPVAIGLEDPAINRDGQDCDDLQFQGVFVQGVSDADGNDDIWGPDGSFLEPYQSGYAFVFASDDTTLSLAQDPDTGEETGIWSGQGVRFPDLERLGQPPYISEGSDGMIGARFRGAWYQRPSQPGQPPVLYDPISLFGYTVDSMPDLNGFNPPIGELLISAPNSGVLSVLPPLNLSADLAGFYTADVPTAKVATFDYGMVFSRVLSAKLRVLGTSTNVARLKLTVLDPQNTPIPGASRELVLWDADRDRNDDLEYDELFGAVFDFSGPSFPDTLEISLHEAARDALALVTQQTGGPAGIRLEILEDCTVEGSTATIDFASLEVVALAAGVGAVTIVDGQDYTVDISDCPGIDDDGDREGEATRPMSIPSVGCVNARPPVRAFCFPEDVAKFFGEEFNDAFGWARFAGDLDLDGVPDIACGAPGSDNNPFAPDLDNCPPFESDTLDNNGKVYFIYGRPVLGSGLPCVFERFEVRGTHDDDQFGRVQGNAGDMNGDGNDDVFFAAEGYDAVDGIEGLPVSGIDAGFVGVMFGNPQLTGEIAINAERVGTGNFLGCKFVGGSPGARLGGGTPANTSFFASTRGQYGVSGAGDFNLDGFDDLLITAPGQEWPGVSIEFTGPVSDGDSVVIKGIENGQPRDFVYEFDLDGSWQPASIRVQIASPTADVAHAALLDAIATTNAESINVASITSRTQFPFPQPDNPTITFLARRPTDPFSVTAAGAGINVTEFIRQGVAYLIFGHDDMRNRLFVLPQDLNRRVLGGRRFLRGIVFVSAYEQDEEGLDATPDEAPIEVVSRVGDIDGDGFVDIILGAPTADFINILAPDQRRQASGDAYLIYGNQFGLNDANAP